MHGQQDIKDVKQVEEAVNNSAVISNDLECEKYRISVRSFVILYSLYYHGRTITVHRYDDDDVTS